MIAGCASAPPVGLPAGTHVQDAGYAGRWTDSAGREVVVKPASRRSFRLTIRDAEQTENFRGHLVEVDGRRLCEISVFDPGARDGKGVPVFHYALVERQGDTLKHAPLRSEWLRQAVAGARGAAYIETSQAASGSGGAVVQDGDAMRELLRKALADPAAFGSPEVLTRAK